MVLRYPIRKLALESCEAPIKFGDPIQVRQFGRSEGVTWCRLI